jgi:monoamine oxidase
MHAAQAAVGAVIAAALMSDGEQGRGSRRRLARGPGMRAAVSAYASHAQAARREMPLDEVVGEAATRELVARERRLSRREVIAGAGALAASGLALTHPAMSAAMSKSRRDAPTIAIVGGGLAGIRCAHLLWTDRPSRPLASTIYEANPERAGGRCWTLRDYFADGLITEHGGAFLDTTQHAVRHLAHMLGLSEEIVDGGKLPGLEQIAWIDHSIYNEREVNADWQAVGYATFQQALGEAEEPAAAAHLDAMSVPEWLESTEIGTSSRFGKLMLSNTVTENGGDPEAQSALALIELLSDNPSARKLTDMAEGNERFHIVGGSDQLVTGMLSALPADTLKLGCQLIALRANPDGSTTLVFDESGVTLEQAADIVVLALPFTTLREVDLSAAGLSASKRRVIDRLGMGTNAKIHVELTRKTWPSLGFDGSAYGEWDTFCCGWDDSVALGDDGGPALYLCFPGGKVGATGITGQAHGPAPEQDVQWLLSELDQFYPGTTAAFTGRGWEDHWAADPLVHGAYSYPRVGQATTFYEIAAKTEGTIHFAGEHTSPESFGFMNGAVETGERAAKQILRRT